MILCVTPNPAIDRALVLPEFVPGKVYRTNTSLVTAGGKGINVARVISTLGGEALCLGLLGGHSGQWLADLVRQEGLLSNWTWQAGETRTAVIVVSRGEATVLNEAGAGVTETEWAALAQAVTHDSAGNPWVCFCGSLPPGISPESFATLLRNLITQGREVWVDTSAEALATAARVESINLKVNGAEAATLLGNTEIATVTQALAAGRQLLALGAKTVIITLGRDGAVVINHEGGWWAYPPALAAISAVGSGDAFLAGWLLARSQGQGVAEALRWGCAAGAANALTATSGQLMRNDFERLRAGVVVEVL